MMNIFKIENTYKTTIISLIITVFSALLAYNVLIATGYTNPDGVMEGISFYNNAAVASGMSGRWLVRYLIKGFGGIINPLVDVIFYAVCVFISMIILKNIWESFSKISLYLSCALLIVSPSVTTQLGYLYMSPSYGVCCLLSFVYLYLVFKKDKIVYALAASFAVACMLGLYQSYIGMAALLVGLTLIIKSFSEDRNHLIKKTVIAIISAIVGCVLYFLIMNLDLKIHNLTAIDRIGDVSLKTIISSLPTSTVYTYQRYFSYFMDGVFKRKYVFMLLGIILVVLFAISIFKLIRNKKIFNACYAVLLFAAIPLLNNAVYLAFPGNLINLVMEFQNIIIIVFILELSDVLNNTKLNYLNRLLVLYLCWTYIMCANATFKCYEMSYRSLNSKMEMLVDDIIHTEGYKANETPVIIYGFIEDDVLRENYPIYNYAISFPKNVAFWEDANGINYGRRNYFLYYFGYDFKLIDDGQAYSYYLFSEEFKEMPVWPESGSIEYTDWGYVIVKLNEEPIICYW